MSTQEHHKEYHYQGNSEERVDDDDNREAKQAKKPIPTTPPPTPISTITSPSQDFSFTVSLHPSPPSSTTIKSKKSTTTTTSSSAAIDFAPADDIFFHGHLLPLHLVSNPPAASRRSSNFSIDSLCHGQPEKSVKFSHPEQMNTTTKSSSDDAKSSGGIKHSSFSSFFGFRKWFKKGLDVSRLLKNVVEPLFPSKGEKDKHDLRRRPHSFSGRSNSKSSHSLRRRGKYSLPTSTRTSPANSGLLTSTVAASSNDQSTMEELQSAIQAAIAHCKNSTSNKEDMKKI